MRRILLYGCPRPVGGANVEAGHTALLWRKMGLRVSVLPCEPEPPENPWPARLAASGCEMLAPVDSRLLPKQTALYRSIVVDFACRQAVKSWDTLARMGCKLIHVPCMAAPPSAIEYDAFRHRPPTAVVFQSRFQQGIAGLQYAAWGLAERQALIHGAFDPTDYPFAPVPHTPAEPFMVGRLARDVPAKWSPRLLEALTLARQRVPLEAEWMGWTPAMARYTGQPPDWVTHYPPGAMPTQRFLQGLHALLCTGECNENWSRVVLEAFAAGVPVIADRRAGYCEQIEPTRTGFLCDTPQEFADAIVMLAQHEKTRLAIAERARSALGKLANPEAIGAAWKNLFTSDDLA